METIQKTSISELENLAVSKLLGFCKKTNEEITDKDIDIAKIHGSIRGTNSRIGATKRVQDGTQLAVIRSIAENREEMKKYVKATMPDYLPK